MAPGVVVNLQPVFETPAERGFYLLDWDLKDGQRWFSIDGRVPPGIVEVDVEQGVALQLQSRDVSRWYRRSPGRALDASVERIQLWEGAWALIRTHPFLGSGPDSFRLLYGAALGYKRWDTNIRANSLYLELLTSCGILGLVAFLVTMTTIRWTVQPAALAVAVFLVHGVVDSFLMTTPIYFAFWVLVGTVHDRRTPAVL
jgi:O-antigen ligase